MSKESKFLSILADMAWGDGDGQEAAGHGLDSGKLNELLLWLEEYASCNGLHFVPELPGEAKGTLQLHIREEDGGELISQVRLFPKVKENSDRTRHYLNNGELRMVREMTDEEGNLRTELPAGGYDIEISRGSEYEVIHERVMIEENQDTIRYAERKSPVDLKNTGWYCGDLHHHSIYSSPVYGGTDPVVESPLTVARSMRASGASFGALSDHHNILNHEEWKLTKTSDFIPIVSKEISTSNGHVMALGVEKDIIYRIPEDRDRTDEYLKKEFIHITESIKAAGGLCQINHPRDHSRAISWNPAYNDILSIFETMEIWNGSNPMYSGTANDRAFRFWRELLEEGVFLPATTGSDTHNIRANDYGLSFRRLKWLEELLREGHLTVPEALQDKVQLFFSLCEKELGIFEKWAKSNLSSGGVRTYVYMEGEPSKDKILDSLKKGRSFLTNGPILIPKVNGTIPGETLKCLRETVNIEIKLIANRPLERLYLYRNGREREEVILDTAKSREGFYDYSLFLPLSTRGLRWIFFRAESDCTNMAITNPVFLEQPERAKKTDRKKSMME